MFTSSLHYFEESPFRSEWQNVYDQSRMEEASRERRDYEGEARRAVDNGKFATVWYHEVFCRHTDASIGEVACHIIVADSVEEVQRLNTEYSTPLYESGDYETFKNFGWTEVYTSKVVNDPNDHGCF